VLRRCPTCGYQLLPSERECPKCKFAGASSPTAPAPTPSSSPPPTSGLAVASLVVGILALGGLLAIPGLILGIVALVKVNRSQGRLWGRGLAWAGIGLSSLGLLASLFLAAVLFPVFVRAREAAKTATCLSNVKQLSLAVIMYAQDHDDKLPPADTWCDSLRPYVKDARIFVCPNARQLKSGYAYNRALSGRPFAEVAEPQRTVLLYESDLGWNGAGGPETLASPRRHFFVGNVFGFVDGHVKRVAVEEQSQLLWQPQPASAAPQ